jgi:predicted nucleotide-binding protein
MGDETQELDLSKEKLTEYIVRPYRNGRRFLCKGTVVCPSEVTTIRIVETEQPSEEILQGRKGLLGLLTDSFSLLESKGKDVTRDFIIIRKRKPKKKALQKKTSPNSQDVFIVHGRDLEPVKQLKTILAGLGLNPIVLHEKPSGSRMIVEKLEKYSDVGYVFVILTPDDVGGPFKGKVPVLGETLLESSPLRARQNVILEFGYFMGKLGRNRVCCLYRGDVELPSDMHGIVYVPFRESVGEARDMIIKELEAAGYEIKTEK